MVGHSAGHYSNDA